MVHIDVDNEVRDRLLALKTRFGLEYNDLISMALTFMEKKKTQIFIEADIVRVTVNVKKAQLDTGFAKTLIEKGYDIFVPKINARQANYIKRKLEAQLTVKATVHPVTVKNEDGFLIMFTPENAKL